MTNKENFLYPRNRYHGQFKPEKKFTQQISYIVSLQTGGKLSPEEAYQQIKALWKQLKRSRKQLGIGQDLVQGKDEQIED